AEVGRNGAAKSSGSQLVNMLPTREQWLEVYKAINECLPRDEGAELDNSDIEKMNRISLDSITCKKQSDVGTWFSALSEDKKSSMMENDRATGPSGPGYVFTLSGHHYHHDPTNPRAGMGHPYIIATLMKNLNQDFIVRKDPL